MLHDMKEHAMKKQMLILIDIFDSLVLRYINIFLISHVTIKQKSDQIQNMFNNTNEE